MNRRTVAITLGIMCLILTLAISVQYRTIKSASTLVGTSGKNSELKSELNGIKAEILGIKKKFGA